MKACIRILALSFGALAFGSARAQDAYDQLEAPPSVPTVPAPPTETQALPQPSQAPYPVPQGLPAPGAYGMGMMPGGSFGPIGSVIRTRDDRVLVQPRQGGAFFVGQLVVIHPQDTNDALGARGDRDVVGEVESLRPEGAVVRIGPNEAVGVGDDVAQTSRSRTSTTLAPAMPRNLVRLELMVGTFLRETGIIGEATLGVHRGAGYYFVTLPSSAYFAERTVDGVRYTENSGLQLMAGGGLQQRFVMLGLSAGITLARHEWPDVAPESPRGVPALGTHLRIGALDGLSFTTDLTLAVGRFFENAIYRADFGIYAPFAPRVLVGLRGGVWLTGQSYSDLHLLCRIRIRGNGGDGSWYAKGAMTFIWINQVPYGSGGYGYGADGATLGFQVGFERRFGIRSPAPDSTL